MAFDTRNNSAMSKRAEQLKRWEESDTNRELGEPKNPRERKIKFTSECIFLAACMSGDKEEVVHLLKTGANINTANVDGLTALHQACIDDNLEMVEFLVQSGADVNRQDNEGWTPLHATASCGFLSIAAFLIDNGADLAAVSTDGELVIDIAESSRMEELLQKNINAQGINCDEARKSEEIIMLADAKNWLRSDASEADKPHPRTGATALHVAAAKGYCKVLSLLLATRADVDKQDNDGWTPLHAAAHWGQKEAAQMLVSALADMDTKNYAGQTIYDVADPSILRVLDELKKNNKRTKRRPASQIRISDNMDNHIETPSKVIRVDVKPEFKDVDGVTISYLENITESDINSGGGDEGGEDAIIDDNNDDNNDDDDSDDTESTESSHSTSVSECFVDEKPKPPSEPAAPIPKEINSVADDDAPWRRTSGSIRTRAQQENSPPKNQVPEKETPTQTTESEVILRRTQSFENDEKFYQKYQELRARIKANSCPVLPATPVSGVIGVNNLNNNINNSSTNSYSVQRSTSLKDHRQLRKTVLSPIVGSPSTPVSTVLTQPGQVRRPAAEELVKSKFNSVNNLAINQNVHNNMGAGNRQSIIGGSATALNQIKDANEMPMPRNASSVVDLVNSTKNETASIGSNSSSNSKISSSTDSNSSKNNNNGNGNKESPSNSNSKKPADESKANAAETSSIRSKFTPGNIFKNFFKSFVPPVRDEESETQRKAHAKRVRETRRSTQGVTLDEIKSAEELVKKKNMNNNNNNSENPTETTTTTTTSTINDRVPVIEKSSTDEDHPINATSTSSLDQTIYKNADNPISASFTLSSPSSNQSNKKLIAEDDPPTATFTIAPPPQPPTSVRSTSSSSSSSESKDNVENVDESKISATINVPIVNNKTDLESLTKTASPTIAAPTHTKSDDSIVDTTITAVPAPTVDFTFNKMSNDKQRSLFDIDNASSLSLADKLRNEANKYSADSANDDSDVIKQSSATVEFDNDKKTDSSPVSPNHGSSGGGTERRPSWRLKFDAGSKFKLEDAPPTTTTSATTTITNNSNSTNNSSSTTSVNSTTSSVVTAAPRRLINNNLLDSTTNVTTSRPVSAPTLISSANSDSNNERIKDNSSEVTLSLRRPKSIGGVTVDDKDNDKENDIRSAQATQAAIQRRRRPKRRSTGVVHVDMDDIDPDKQESNDGDDKESGSERTSRSRLGSTSSITSQQDQNDVKKDLGTENGDHIDYKALYEAARIDNEKLKSQLKKKDDELTNSKATVERFANATTKNSLSEIEKRERRAMERKLSEMEEELKHLEALKTENQRLKDENGALIRVISKLSK